MIMMVLEGENGVEDRVEECEDRVEEREGAWKNARTAKRSGSNT